MSKAKYQVYWSETALQDLKRVYQFISHNSLSHAQQAYLSIKQKVNNLSEMPFQGRVVPELQYFQILTFRELIFAPWRILYKVENDKVNIIAVIDGRRNVEDILLERFIQ